MNRALAVTAAVLLLTLLPSFAPAQDLPILTRGELYDVYPLNLNTIPYANVRRVQVIRSLGGSWYEVNAIFMKDGQPNGESPNFYLNIDALTTIFPIRQAVTPAAAATPAPN